MNPTLLHRCALLVAACFPVCSVYAQSSEPQQLERFEIVSKKQPYRTLLSTGATKSDVPVRDLPQSVKVIGADLLDDVGVTRLAGALELASGISAQNNFGGLWDSYSIRGFTGDPNYGSDFLVNGFSSSRGYNGLRDSANTNSVEILKGPAAALFGRGEPGGVVNITTKKPLFQASQTVEGALRSYDTYRGAADITGPLSQNFAYRLNAAYEQGDSFRDYFKQKRHLVSPSFIWLLSENTTLSYEVEAFEQKSLFDRGVVAVNGQLGLIPNSRYLGEPNDGDTTIKSTGHQVFLQHQFNDDWSLQSGVSFRDSSLGGYSTEASSLRADGRTLWRQRRFRDFDAKDLSGRLELLGKVTTGPLVHHLLFGADGYRFADSRTQLRVNPNAAVPYAIDIYNPVYGQAKPTLAPSIDTDETQYSGSVYTQDQIDFSEQWKGLAGVRYDRYRQSFVNNRFGFDVRQNLSATSPRVGVVYQPLTIVSLYATAAKGFRPNSGTSITGEGFAPESSHAYEVGIKLDTPDNKISSTLALYQIKKKNVLTLNPLDTNFSLAAGEVESKGVELDVSGEVAPNLRLTAAYAYTDAKVTKDNVLKVGGTLADVPKNSGSLLLVQEFRLWGGVAALGGGANYVGERNGDVAISSTFVLPAYTTARLISSFTPNKHVRISLDIDNLFDKQYYASSYQQIWVNPGAPRTFNLRGQYRF